MSAAMDALNILNTPMYSAPILHLVKKENDSEYGCVYKRPILALSMYKRDRAEALERMVKAKENQLKKLLGDTAPEALADWSRDRTSALDRMVKAKENQLKKSLRDDVPNLLTDWFIDENILNTLCNYCGVVVKHMKVSDPNHVPHLLADLEILSQRWSGAVRVKFFTMRMPISGKTRIEVYFYPMV